MLHIHNLSFFHCGADDNEGKTARISKETLFHAHPETVRKKHKEQPDGVRAAQAARIVRPLKGARVPQRGGQDV